MKNSAILVVDDSDFDRTMLRQALVRICGLPTVEASSGEQCLKILANQTIGLIVMDILMPEMTGSEVLRKIREKFNAIELPIIMVTANNETSEIISCLRAGANDYITKPVNFEVTASRINTHLMLAEKSHEMSRLKELAALDAMITTYNHEINNPLSIALGCVNTKLLKSEEAVEKLRASLWRVADIVKKIREVTDKKNIEYQSYEGTSKMVKVK